MLSKKAIAGGSIALFALAAYGVFVTGTQSGNEVRSSSVDSSGAAPALADSTLATALQLIRLPVTAEERPLAQDALRHADRDMDLSFASAVRREANNPRPLSPEALIVTARLKRALQRARADSLLFMQLSAPKPTTTDTTVSIDNQADLAKARLEIDHDDIDDARLDLMEAGGDPLGRIQAMVQEHKEASQGADSIQVKVTASLSDGGLLQVARRYSSLRLKGLQLQRAAHAADLAATALSAQHQVLEKKIADTTVKDSATVLARTRRRASESTVRSAAGRRSENQHRLASVYGNWLEVVQAQERLLLHRALRELLVIIAMVLVWLFSDALISRALATQQLERRSMERLRVVTRVSLQALGLLVILIVLFGTPSNLGTIIGLAGAGLTVALKDFIVSFVGWLVLMGKDGVRLGDLVEINGVTGEVVELGMFNTVLHETGNWTDAGHPTGRRVTFTNSYAIEGHYFNFSTSGQWLWDEVRVSIPAGKDPYRVVESLQKRVQEVTAESAQLAAQEWKGASRSPGRNTITAAPAFTIKPIMGGVEATLRYITHAAERYEVRAKLYQSAVEVLGEAKA
ncbi:MAG: mechanosensitive ion channel domain-containing protein [bacterium]